MARDSVIGQHVLDNPERVYKYDDSWFSILGKAQLAEHLHISIY